MTNISQPALILRLFPDQLCPAGHHLTLEGQRYELVQVTPERDGRVLHLLRPDPS